MMIMMIIQKKEGILPNPYRQHDNDNDVENSKKTGNFYVRGQLQALIFPNPSAQDDDENNQDNCQQSWQEIRRVAGIDLSQSM